MRFILVLLLSSASLASQASVNLSLADFSCQEVSDSCYQEIYQNFKSNREALETPSGLAGRINKSSSILRLQDHRTKYVYVMIHGVWSVETHFNPLAEWIVANKSANVLQFTLPGHGYGREAQDTDSIRFTYQDWENAAQDALAVAKLFGDKVILVGHSLGGLLSINLARSQDPQIVGLALLEPALRIDPALTVPGHAVENVIGDFKNLAPIVGYTPDHPIPSYFGWLVDQLARQIFSDVQRAPKKIPSSNIVSVAQEIQIPAVIFNNLFDYVVEPSSVRLFAQTQPDNFAYQSYHNLMIRHGLILKQKYLPIILKSFAPYVEKVAP